MDNHRVRYKIVKATSRKELVEKVNQAINSGWFPTGGLAVYTEDEIILVDHNGNIYENDTITQYFVQAMIWEK